MMTRATPTFRILRIVFSLCLLIKQAGALQRCMPSAGIVRIILVAGLRLSTRCTLAWTTATDNCGGGPGNPPAVSEGTYGAGRLRLARVCLRASGLWDCLHFQKMLHDTDASTCGRRRIPCGNTFPPPSASTSSRRGSPCGKCQRSVKAILFVLCISGKS